MDETSRTPKRRRLNDDGAHKEHITISSANQLHELLSSGQDTSPAVKIAIDSFKKFLTEISQNDNLVELSKQLKILRQYCNTQAAASTELVDFPDLLSTWSFASQSSSEGVLSAVPSALAHFLRTISNFIEFRDFGRSLCHSLLKKDQVRLIDRGLSAPRFKEHLINPCLLLLIEIVSFDGGAFADAVFSRRDTLLHRLESFLETRTSSGTKRSLEERKKLSARRLTLRLVVEVLKYLNPGLKAEFLSHGRTFTLCLRSLIHDGDDVIKDILKAIDRDILGDKSLPATARTRFFSPQNLLSLANLYDYDADTEHQSQRELDQDASSGESSVRDTIHLLLLKICHPDSGIILPQNGWYPLGIDPEAPGQEAVLDLGLESPYYFDDYNSSVPIRNATISAFSQGLKPHSDNLQRELLLECFRNAPELVADYFSENSSFSSPPRDNPSWLGHFALLFSVIQLPIPDHFGWSGGSAAKPPPVSIMIESLLPRPLDQSTLARCFNMNEDIMVLSAARIMTIALEKLQKTIALLKQSSKSSSTWTQAARILAETFEQRIAPPKDVILALNRTSKEDLRLKGSLIECLAGYYKILPLATSNTKFDVGLLLSEWLKSCGSADEEERVEHNLIPRLADLVTIARMSPGTKWWHSTESTQLSPFSLLLRFCVENHENESVHGIQKVIGDLMIHRGILNDGSQIVDAFLASLLPSKKWEPSQHVYEFLDNCLSRTMQKPVKYLDKYIEAAQYDSDKNPLSLLAVCIAEQWPFIVKRLDNKDLKNIMGWISRFFKRLELVGGNFRVMGTFQKQMIDQVTDSKLRMALQSIVEKQQKRTTELPQQNKNLDSDQNEKMTNGKTVLSTSIPKQGPDTDLELFFDKQTPLPNSLTGIDRWTKTDFETEVHNGRLERLFLCLLSPESEIKLHAFQTLQSLMIQLETSSYTEKQPLYLLIGELMETFRSFNFDNINTPKSLPSLISALACHLLQVISNPSDKIYGKANRFLLRAPSWDPYRTITYWTDKIILSEPEDDEDPVAYTHEVEWFLDILTAGLRTKDDLELYRRSSLFGKLLSFYSASTCARSVRRKILGLVWTVVQIEGGADMLITRLGVLAWLGMMTNGELGHVVDALKLEVEKRCDGGYIDKWRKKIRGQDGGSVVVTS